MARDADNKRSLTNASQPLDDENRRVLPNALYDPFERRLLIRLKIIVSDIGLYDHLASHGVPTSKVNRAFERSLSNSQLSGFDVDSETSLEVENEAVFRKSAHPLLLGLTAGIMIYPRAGVGERPISGATTRVHIELTDIKLRRTRHHWDQAYEDAWRGFVTRVEDYARGKTYYHHPPSGLTAPGFRLITNALMPDMLTSEEMTRQRNTPIRSFDIGYSAQFIFGMGIWLGHRLRLMEDITFVRRSRVGRRPRAFYVTGGYDSGFEQEAELRERIALLSDGNSPLEVEDRVAGRISSEPSPYSGNHNAYSRDRHANAIAAFASQGAREMAWWPLHSNFQVGDVALVRLAEFRPPDEPRSEQEERIWSCDAFRKGQPCDLQPSTDEDVRLRKCIIHTAQTFAGQSLGIPGLDPERVWEWPHPVCGHLDCLGLVTTTPEYFPQAGGTPQWGGNLGFLRWLPIPLDPTTSEVAGAVSLLPTERRMAYLQFDGDGHKYHRNVSFSGERWLELRNSLTAMVAKALGSYSPSGKSPYPGWQQLELQSWQDDLVRLSLCSRNLMLGASLKSLSLLAPDYHFPLGLYPLPEQAEEYRKESQIWLSTLRDNSTYVELSPGFSSSSRLPSIVQFPMVISTLEGGNVTRRALSLDDSTERAIQTGHHEMNTVLDLTASRCNALLEDDAGSIALVVVPGVLSPRIARVFRHPDGLNILNHKVDEAVRDIAELTLPADPAWTRTHTVWRLRLNREKPPGERSTHTLYMGLVDARRAAISALALQKLIEERHFAHDHSTLHLALGRATGNGPEDWTRLREAHYRHSETKRELLDSSITTFLPDSSGPH